MYPKFLTILACLFLAGGLLAQDASPTPEESPEAAPTGSPTETTSDAAPESSPESAEAETEPTPEDAEPSPTLSPAPSEVAPEDPPADADPAAPPPEDDASETSPTDLREEVEETIDLPTDQSAPGEEDQPIADAPGGFVTESVTDSTFVEPSSFVPEEIGAAAQQLDAIPQAPENEAEKERQLRLAYRKAKTELLRDERVQQLLEIAKLASTPEEKRGAMREYYTLLHNQITDDNPDLQEYSEDLRDAHYLRLKQHNVVPTTPLSPPPGIAPTPDPNEASQQDTDGEQPPETNES